MLWIETLISVVTEKTRLLLFNAYEPFSFNLVLLVIEKALVITTNLAKPESASDVFHWFLKQIL